MATDPNIRDLFRAESLPAGRGIDTDTVIRRSKRRRLPAQVGVGGLFTLAIGGVAIAGVHGFGSAVPISTVSSDSADSGATTESGAVDPGAGPVAPAQEGAAKRAPADRINLCGGTVAEVAPSATGLVLTPGFPDATADAESVEGTVTLSNTGSESVAGYTSASPAITLSQNGVVLWHSNGPTIQVASDVMLAPGESIEFPASFTPVVCTVDDDLAESFAADLPPVQPGEYQVSAAADVVIDGNAELVTGPQQSVRIG